MKRLLDEAINKSPFLKLYFDKDVTHLNVDRLLEQNESRDVTQGLSVSDFITNFSYKVNINENTKNQKNSIINGGLKSNNVITYLDLAEENFYVPNPHSRLHPSVIPQMLSSNHALVYLNLTNNNLGEALGKILAQGLKGNNSILHLNISGNALGQNGFEPIAVALQYNNSILDLDISNNNLAVQGGKHLALALKDNKSITYLNLKSNQLADQGSEEVIKALNKEIIIHLNISSNNIGDQTVRALSHFIKNNTSLQYLDTSFNDVGKTSEFTDAIKFNHSLKILHDSGSSLGTNISAKFTAKVIEQNSGITNLNLNQNYFDYAGAKELANALIINKYLTTLSLKSSNFKEAGAILLAQGLERNTTLIKLDLSNNNIGDTGFVFLANALKENNSITHLNLSANNIKAIEALSYMLNSIICLDISNNNIDPDGATVIGEALKANHCLTDLHLSQNKLAHQGIKSILTALENNSSLVLLDLSNNNIGDTGMGHIASLLKDNKSLATLNIGNNGITQTGATHIADLISNNLFIACIEFGGNTVAQQGENLINTALNSNFTVIKFTICGRVPAQIVKNNQLLQEKLQDLVHEKFKSKAEEDIFKELLILVKQLQVSTVKSITPELSDATPLAIKEYLQIIANITKEESLKYNQNKDSLLFQESLISENPFLEILSSMDIAGATDHYYDWS